MTIGSIDAVEHTVLVAAFRDARQAVEQRASWSAEDPALPADTCRYCGKFWQHRFGSKLDGHAACLVTEDFKRRVGKILRASPRLTYAMLVDLLGVTPGVISSWAYSAGIAGPVDHALRRKGRQA